MRISTILLPVVASLAFLLPLRADSWSGTWTAEIKADGVALTMLRDDRPGTMTSGKTFRRERLHGLPDKAADGPVAFSMTAEAGTIRFEGSVRGGRGIGWYRLTPDAEFASHLRSLGFSTPGADEVLIFTIDELKLSDVRGLKGMGYELDNDELLQVAIFRIIPSFVREMEALGWTSLSFDTLVQLRVGRVDSAFVRELQSTGLRTDGPSQVAQLGIVGVTPVYVDEMAKAGYPGLSADQYLTLKALGIDAAYVARLRTRGVDKLPLDELVRIRALGIDEILDRRTRD